MRKIVVAVACVMGFSAPSQAALLISQYYEGPNTNKWIEIQNTDVVPVNLATAGLILGHWNNANAEGYKTNVAPSFSVALNTGTIPAGGFYLVGNTGNTTPSYAVADRNDNSVINFNGNDSIAIYTNAVFATANILDAIGFTTANEGQDKSFVRTGTSPGFNTTAGSNATTFTTVWQNPTLATVDSAAVGTPERLVNSVPEPTTLALLPVAAGMFMLRRRKSC